MSEPGDNQLVQECLSGDERAFEAILLKYQGPVFNAVLRMVRDWDEAGDLTQNAFLKAYQRLSSFDPEQKFFIGDDAHQVRAEQLRGCEVDSVQGTQIGGEQGARHVQDALMSISSDYRAVLVLRHFEDCSYDEISQIVGVPEKTVKSRLFTARRLLKERLVARGLLR